MVATLVRLRLLVLTNSFRRSTSQLVAVIIGAVYGLGLLLAAIVEPVPAQSRARSTPYDTVVVLAGSADDPRLGRLPALHVRRRADARPVAPGGVPDPAQPATARDAPERHRRRARRGHDDRRACHVRLVAPDARRRADRAGHRCARRGHVCRRLARDHVRFERPLVRAAVPRGERTHHPDPAHPRRSDHHRDHPRHPQHGGRPAGRGRGPLVDAARCRLGGSVVGRAR